MRVWGVISNTACEGVYLLIKDPSDSFPFPLIFHFHIYFKPIYFILGCFGATTEMENSHQHLSQFQS